MNGEMRRVSPELRCLSAMRAARARLFNEFAAFALENAPSARRCEDGSLDREYLALVRSEQAFQIAEFFFVVDEIGIGDGPSFRPYIERHNAALRALAEDGERLRLRGFTKARIKSGIFTEEQIAFIELASPPGQLRLDQSSLARLFVELMSSETCRKTAVAMAECGLLERHAVGHKLISSPGRIERMFRSHLSEMIQGASS